MKNKRIIILMYFCTLAGYILAQTPGFNYQAVLRNAQGEVLPNTSVTLEFSLLNDKDDVVLYEERHETASNELGIINLQIGNGVPTLGSLTDIAKAVNLHLKVVNIENGTPIDLGQSPVGTVPLALNVMNRQHLVVKDTVLGGFEIGLTDSDSTVLLTLGGGIIQDLVLQDLGKNVGISLTSGAQRVTVDRSASNELQKLNLVPNVNNASNTDIWLDPNEGGIVKFTIEDTDDENEIQTMEKKFPPGNNVTADLIIKDLKAPFTERHKSTLLDENPNNELQNLNVLRNPKGAGDSICIALSGFEIRYESASDGTITEVQVPKVDTVYWQNGIQELICINDSLSLTCGKVKIPLSKFKGDDDGMSGGDDDSDPTNELQKLSLDGSVLSLDRGGMSVVLGDIDAFNELQKISKNNGIIGLSQDGGFVRLDDDDPTNELQELVMVDGELRLTEGENGVSLEGLSPWEIELINKIRFQGIVEVEEMIVDGVVVSSADGLSLRYNNNQNSDAIEMSTDGGPSMTFMDPSGNILGGIQPDGEGGVSFYSNSGQAAERSQNNLLTPMATMGTAQLEAGTKVITHPEEWNLSQISPNDIKVIVSPQSAQSKGLAVIDKSKTGFTVQELFGGSGSYEFDYSIQVQSRILNEQIKNAYEKLKYKSK